jgi:hypothetical protein
MSTGYHQTQQDRWRQEVANVACPKCGVGAGQDCRITQGASKGIRAGIPHMARLDLARRSV